MINSVGEVKFLRLKIYYAFLDVPTNLLFIDLSVMGLRSWKLFLNSFFACNCQCESTCVLLDPFCLSQPETSLWHKLSVVEGKWL